MKIFITLFSIFFSSLNSIYRFVKNENEKKANTSTKLTIEKHLLCNKLFSI